MTLVNSFGVINAISHLISPISSPAIGALRSRWTSFVESLSWLGGVIEDLRDGDGESSRNYSRQKREEERAHCRWEG